MEKTEISVPAPSSEAARLVFGVNDETRKLIERELPVTLKLRDESILVSGVAADAERAASLLADWLSVAQDSLKGGRPLALGDIKYLLRQAKGGAAIEPGAAKKMMSDILVTTERGKPIGPRTAGQKIYIDALRSSEMVFGIGPAGTGKCIAADSLVLTEAGMLPIGDIGAGLDADDEAPLDLKIWGRDGLETAAGVYCGGVSDTLRFTTRLGFEIETTPEHPLLRLDADGELRWTRADALGEDDIIALSRGARLFGTQTKVNCVPVTHAQDHCSARVRLEELDEEFAYFMGVIVGDGCLTAPERVMLSSADASILALFARIAARWNLKVCSGTAPHDIFIASTQLHALLMHLGLSGGKAATKCVPAAILRAPQPIVAAFLSGLFDADGTIDKRDGTVTFSTVSHRLAREVQTVLLNFGIVAARGIENGRYRGALHRSQLLTIAGADAEVFHQLIGFGARCVSGADALFQSCAKAKLRLEEGVSPRANALQFTLKMGWPQFVVASQDASGQSLTLSRRVLRRYYELRPKQSHVHNPQLSKQNYFCCSAFALGVSPAHTTRAQTKGSFLAALSQPKAYSVAQSNIAQADDETDYLLLPIRSIESSRAPVFDLTVPGSHSFVANGFVNHNTYLAVAAAVAALKNKQVARIILTRPAVEAGERLGFLPGDLEAKIDPYLRPLYDALYDLMDMEKAQKLFERKVIEIAPLAYMRGRTLNDAFVILDEAQNATGAQMKMFLTRLGFGSRMVITGDVTQTDLPRGEESGLKAAARVLPGVKGIEMVFLGQADVVRHNLVQRIIEAYDQNDYPERA